MDHIEDFTALQAEIQSALISTTKTVGQIAAEDLAFQRSLNPEVGTELDEQSERVLKLANALLKSAASISELRAPALQDAEDVDNDWRGVVDVVDSLLEKADTSLDEYTGVIKRRNPIATETASAKPRKQPFSGGNSFRNQNLVKPQLAFDIKPDNIDTSPWKPLLTTKPHAVQSLEDSLGMFTNDFDQQQYHHPYEAEIQQLTYPQSVYTKADPIQYQPVETTTATFVDTEEGVLEMLEELKAATEIAVDLEHHDLRSFVGLVSLMQISTRQKDWIVDTLKPWRQKLQVLNEVFADPKIIKVFHGAYMDIIWLQRDLGLYVVGLFDTHWASRTLGYAGGSLAFLLKKFIDFDADKKYQMADWRIRPLPEEMFFYARADTHFLLYIYDNMRNELIDRTKSEIPDENKMEMVLQKSKETSLQRFERQIYNKESGKGPGGWFSLLIKTPAMFNNEQFAVFRAIHEWRDRIARADDDSTGFVMPNHVVFSLAKLMPMDMVALLGIAHPISHSVKSRSGELLAVIQEAKADGTNGPSMMDVLRPDSFGAVAKANLPRAAAPESPPSIVPAVDDRDLRSNTSSFWGGAFGSSVWESPKAVNTDDGLRLAVPLPALSSEIFADTATAATNTSRSQSSDEGTTPSRAPSKEEPIEPEAFIIKRGAKRKSDAVASEKEDTGGEYDISLNDITSADDEAAQKAETQRSRRAEKKRRKLEKRAAANSTDAGNSASGDGKFEDDDEVPFDYSKAESVLHAKNQQQGGNKKKGEGKGKGKEKKVFDPYSKSTDSAKGMRRVQSERAGRSATFKN